MCWRPAGCGPSTASLPKNRPAIRLDPSAVPTALRHLVPLPELFGVGDDLIREDFRANAWMRDLPNLFPELGRSNHRIGKWVGNG